jgi:hypothetical protein
MIREESALLPFLSTPTRAVLFVPAPVWEKLPIARDERFTTIARHWDLYRNCDVLLIGNAAAVEAE